MTWRRAGISIVGLVLIGGAVQVTAQGNRAGSIPAAHAINIKAADMKWDRIFPEMGARSSEITVLHVDPTTQATKLMIRVPPNFHIPSHWHTANETHTVLRGTFVVECEGQRTVLEAGSFNYMPSRMVHEAWTTPTEEAVLFITVDVAWDINWVRGTPKPADLEGGYAVKTTPAKR